MTPPTRVSEAFPTAAGILFGLGLGGFFDGIVLHQILQWHHMLTSAGYPADSVANLELNTSGDGLFHAAPMSSWWPAWRSCGAPPTGRICWSAGGWPARC